MLFGLQMGFVLLIMLGTFISPHPYSAWDEFFRLLPLFFAALSITLGPQLSRARIRQIFHAFAWSVVASLVISLAIGLINYFQYRHAGNLIPPLNYLFYTGLSFFLENQAGYTALYVLFALAILADQSACGTMRNLAIAFLLVCLFLLAARTQIVLLAILVPIRLLMKQSVGYRRKTVVVLVMLAVGSAAMLWLPGATGSRMAHLAVEARETLNASPTDRINTRWYLWQEALDLWSKKPLLGWGTNEAERLLSERAANQLRTAADTLPVAAVVRSDLEFRNEFIESFYPLSAGAPVYLNSSNTKSYAFPGDKAPGILWEGASLRLKTDNTGFVGIQYRGLIPGYLYRFELRAHDRLRGGMAAWHHHEQIGIVRERAEKEGVTLSGYFVAEDSLFEITSSRYIPTEIWLSDLKLWPMGPVDEKDGEVAGRLDNALVTYIHHFNTHNQYLQVAIDHGAVGLLLFLGTHFFLLAIGLRRRNWLLTALMVALIGSFATEHMLLRDAGLFFYAFWMAFAVYYGLGWRATPEDTRDVPGPK